uniref:Protein FAR1-related sequence 5-like n=1 Tax=Tanacetum cinerariifolium TaxID=118510 RepID=A0A6L2MEI2_TANCI|nr:protein FAR1-related sequence 5-like [Tanacetum cinerariifolium]
MKNNSEQGSENTTNKRKKDKKNKKKHEVDYDVSAADHYPDEVSKSEQDRDLYNTGSLRDFEKAKKHHKNNEIYCHPRDSKYEKPTYPLVLIVGIDVSANKAVDHYVGVKCSWGEKYGDKGFTRSLPKDHMADFHHLDDAREIWLVVKARFGGNEESKNIRKTMLKQEFSEFSVSKEEGLHKGYDRFQKILSQLNQMQAKPDNDDVNIKFLRVLPPSWSQVALTLKTRGSLEYLSFDDLYNKHRSLEIDVKGRSSYGSRSTTVAPKHSTFIGAASTNTKMVYSNQPSHSSSITYTSAHSGSIMKDVDEKARYFAFKISETEEGKQAYGLMAGFKSDFADHAGNAAGSVYDAAVEFSMMGISPKAKIEKKEWEVKLVESLARFDKWKESSKNLAKLINSSMSTRTKLGLGFKEYIGSDEVFDPSIPSVFDLEPENRDVKSLYERFIKGGEMHEDCDVYDNVDNFPSVVSKAAFVPAGCRNSLASTSAGRSILAASRNRPASIHAGRHIPAGRFNKPAPFSAGRSVPTVKINTPRPSLYLHNETPEETTYWEPNVDEPYLPLEGKCFDTIEECVEFYSVYAKKGGFEVKKSTQKKTKSGLVKSKYVMCNRKGVPKEININTLDPQNSDKQIRNTRYCITGCIARIKVDLDHVSRKYEITKFVVKHNHQLLPKEYNHLTKKQRKMPQAEKMFVVRASTMRLGATKAHNLYSKMKCGTQYVHGTSDDFKNHIKDVNAFIGESDAQMLINKMENRKNCVPNFTLHYLVENSELVALFWADEVAKCNYKEFRYIISFDVTFRTNK